ncbi:flagellar hook assembly protein FlgD [Sediminibacillus massiliensis]|uniref:flagellar hook assembly protein FlgD n=1 Tax=Sediminibacillus massiliensis TaxID=1926277 RepID=UPI00098871DB|nr:flagellar hook assembly protein FlgD [Sediminibacillus massiliensis]
MTKIDPGYYLSNQSRGTTSTDLGKDEFLKILMAQLQNQDPLNPMEDKEFISQMASFSSLEQMMNMSKSIDQMAKSQQVTPVIQYSHLIGQEVTYQQESKEENSKSEVIAVRQSDGQAVLELKNGEEVNADSILKVSSINLD